MDKEFLFDKVANDPEAGLSNEQKAVLTSVSCGGSGAIYIRDKAKRMGVASPLSVIKSLMDLGFIEKSKDTKGESILVRIR